MRLSTLSLSVAAVLAFSAAAHAESFVSSASSAGSEVSGSISKSFGASSDSSRKTLKVAAGKYRVTDVAQAQDHDADTMQVALAAVEGVDPEATQTFNLYLPRKALDQQPLAKGQVVAVAERPYGLEFSDDKTQRPFYLVLQDGWTQQMASKVVTI